MKATVHVTLKPGVLDPQGQAIHHAAMNLGYRAINDLRQGKYFEIEISDDVDSETARTEIDRLAREILSNPIIEDYCVELGGQA